MNHENVVTELMKNHETSIQEMFNNYYYIGDGMELLEVVSKELKQIYGTTYLDLECSDWREVASELSFLVQ